MAIVTATKASQAISAKTGLSPSPVMERMVHTVVASSPVGTIIMLGKVPANSEVLDVTLFGTNTAPTASSKLALGLYPSVTSTAADATLIAATTCSATSFVTRASLPAALNTDTTAEKIVGVVVSGAAIGKTSPKYGAVVTYKAK